MKNLFFVILLGVFIFSCNTSKRAVSSNSQDKVTEQDTVRISSDKVEYEIIIIEPGFNTWLVSIARPEGYYSQQFLESRNRIYVIEWNQRVLQPNRFSTNLYEMRIDYQPNIDYGYDVNYKLYNYFIYFQRKYNQRLAGFVPRI